MEEAPSRDFSKNALKINKSANLRIIRGLNRQNPRLLVNSLDYTLKPTTAVQCTVKSNTVFIFAHQRSSEN